MTAALRDLCRDARRRGRRAELAAALRCLAGAVFCALAERRDARRRSRRELPSRRFEGLLQDTRSGLRQLRRQPGLSLAVVGTLAVVLAANAAVFGVVNAVLLERLPYLEPDRVVFVGHHYADMEAAASVPGLLDYRREARAFSGIAASAPRSVNLTGGGDPERLDGLVVTANFFEVLGVRAAGGRAFLPEEEEPGRAGVAVVSHGLWQRRFGGDPGLLGQTIQVDGVPRTVVGIMPEGFRRGRGWGRENLADVWFPLELTGARRDESNRGNEFLDVYARLAPGVSLSAAQADFDRVAAGIRARFPHRYTEVAGWHHRLIPLREEIAAPLRPLLLALQGAVLALLLIAASNVGGLLLARAAARRRETAIRAALGAGRARLVRQWLTETTVLAALAAAAGLGLAAVAVETLERVDRVTLPRAQPIALDARVVAFTLGAALLALVVGGLVPALQGASGRLMAGLSARGSGGGPPLRLRRILVVAQTGLALALLVATGLMLRSVERLTAVDMGFRSADRLVFRVSLPRSRYGAAPARTDFVERLLERTRALPGVRRAAAVHGLPLSDELNSASFEIRLYTPYAQRPFTRISFVLHAEGDREALVAAVRRALAAVDPEQPLDGVTSLAALEEAALGRRRAVARALAGFAAAALGFASLGLYALLAYTVRERSGEIGVRMALGALPSDLVLQFAGEGLALVAHGAVVGGVLAWLAARLLEGLVYGVALADPPTWLGVASTLVTVALAASALPAWRATRVDPLATLRAD